jgi:putative ABC transport system permease protein
VFLVEAAILSLAGGLIGLAAGIGLGKVAGHFLPDFPIQPPGWAVVSAIVVSTLVGLVFGALPARRAARLDPITALARR